MLTAQKEKLLYNIISCDTTGNCNIRCKFCFNDWAKLGANVSMSEDIFKKMIQLLPLAKDNSFYLSCLFEPFINKNFAEFLAYVPEEYRQKCFFTTNLASPLSDEQIEKMSKAHIDHINISMESLEEGTYNDLCEKSNFKTYSDNLRRLTEAFRKAEDPPKLRYITMILRANYKELPFIAYRCKNEFLSSANEFRTPYVGPNMRLEWLDDQILTKKELADLTGLLGCIGIPMEIDTGTDTDSYAKTIETKRERSEEEFIKEESENRCYELRVSSNGLVKVYAENKCYDLHDIDNPYEFFLEKLKSVYRDRLKKNEYTGDISDAEEIAGDMFCIDRFTDSDGILGFEGWAAVGGQNMSEFKKYIVLRSGSVRKVYEAQSVSRPDVASALGNEGYTESGFKVNADSEGLSSDTEVFMLFKNDSGKSFIKRFSDTLAF